MAIKMTRLFMLSLFVGFTVVSSCNKTNTSNSALDGGPSEFNLTVAKREIEEANRHFMDLFLKGDSAGLANSYTHDAKFMIDGAPTAIGRANIEKAMLNIFRSGVTKIDIRTKDVFGTEALLVEEGELTLFIHNDTIAEKRYIVLWKKQEGKWKVFRDIVNVDELPPVEENRQYYVLPSE